ncbi:MAG: anti-sigma factor antagonist [Candidatus Sumerlaeaceae bacterium]|jgi:anti-anti-sigma factor
MELEIYQLRSDVYILLRGRIVLEECERLKSACLPLIRKGIDQVYLDLSKVEYIDSAGLGVLVGFKMTASKNRARIVLIQPSRPVADILYISKLDGIFDILTGAEADLLKAQMIQTANRIGVPVAEKFASASATETPSGSTPAVPRMGVGISPRPEPPVPPRGEWGPKAAEAEREPMRPFAASVRSEAEPEAFASMDSAVRTQKEMIEEHCRKAVEYMKVGNYDMAVLEYEKALRIDPEYLPALNNLAIVYEKQPSWIPKAIEQWEIVLRVSQQRGDQKHMDRARRHLANLRQLHG